MTNSELKLETCNKPFWGNKELMLILGCKNTQASKYKQMVVKAGGAVPTMGQKIYRDVACKVFNINVKREIEIIRLIIKKEESRGE